VQLPKSAGKKINLQMENVSVGKCNRQKARENMQPTESAGKHATDGKRGKTCNLRKTRKNMQPTKSAEKHATDGKRGKICNQQNSG